MAPVSSSNYFPNSYTVHHRILDCCNGMYVVTAQCRITGKPVVGRPALYFHVVFLFLFLFFLVRISRCEWEARKFPSINRLLVKFGVASYGFCLRIIRVIVHFGIVFQHG